jgi:hypothetical protein
MEPLKGDIKLKSRVSLWQLDDKYHLNTAKIRDPKKIALRRFLAARSLLSQRF